MQSEPSQSDSPPPTRLLKLGNFLARLSQSESDEEALALLESPAEREVWKRAALVRYFDEQLFVEVLAAGLSPDSPATQYAHFITRSGVEAIPRTSNLHRLKDAVREEYLAAWVEDAPEDARARSRELPAAQLACYRHLAEFYEKQGTSAQLDLLNCLLSFDQEQARKLFLELYDSAYANFDLPTCYTLLKMLDEHAPRLHPQMEQLRVQYRQFYNARSIFATEYYQSAVYFTRAYMRDAFAEFLAQSKTWIFQLYATGGMGKTIFLRWLIARYCIPAPHNIPVARLDFDFLPLATIEKHPWLLLQPLAVQLNEQLPGFERLAISPTGLREFAPLLREARSKEQKIEQDIAASKLESSGSYWQAQAPQDFGNALAGNSINKPILIILDTLEEMVLTRPATLMTILKYFAGIQEQCPQMRLVLAGRYDLRVKIADFSDQYWNVATSVELTKFTEPEAVEYLREKRHLAAHLPLAAIAKRSEGIPFKLSLFADLASTRESLTEKEVLNFPRADFAYLIERIIERVAEDDVRWVLRYGVLPRRLTRSFLETVMRPSLEAERAKSRRDQPNNLPKEAARYQHKELWRNQLTPLDLDQVWQHLQQYASGFGWITHEPLSESFKFQPEVRNPMRDLLQTQKIFPVLQKSAVQYFEKLARQNPTQWAEYTSDAVYHQFQLQGADAGKYWREKIHQAETKQSPHAVKLLAADLTGPDYLDEGTPRQREDGRPILRVADLRHAFRTAAEAAIQLAHESSRRTAEWSFAYEQLTKLRALQLNQANGLLPLYLQAAEAMQSEQSATAQPLLEELFRQVKDPGLRLSLAWQKAELQAALQSKSAEKSYQTALHLAVEHPKSLIDPTMIRQTLAAWYDRQCRFAEAEREYQTLWEPRGKRQEQLEMGFAFARFFLRYEQFANARKIIREVATVAKTPADKRTLFLLFAELELASRRLESGWKNLTIAEEIRPIRKADFAVCKEMFGILSGERLDVADAMENLETATHLWGELGDLEAQQRCRLHCAKIQLRGVGNLKESRGYLEAWRRAMSENSQPFESETRLQLELLDIELLTRDGAAQAGGEVRDQWHQLTDFAWIKQVPAWRALLLTTGVALNFADPAQVDEWVSTLQQIEPASARLATLRPLRLMTAPLRLSKPVRESLRNLFDAEIRTVCASKDTAAHVPIAADFYRLLAAAPPNFWASIQQNSNLWSAFAAREIRQAQDRWFNSIDEELEPVSTHQDDAESSPSQPIAWELANAIEQAERDFRQGRYDECEILVNRYKDRLNALFLSQWQARCQVLIGKLHQGKYTQRGEDEDLKMAEAAFSNAEERYQVLDDRPASAQVMQLREQLKLLSTASSISAGAEPPPSPAPIPEIPIQRGDVETPAYTIWFQFRNHMRLGSDLLRGKGNQAALVVPPKGGDTYPARQSLLAQLSAMSRHDIVRWIAQEHFAELGEILLTRKEVAALRQGYYQAEDLQLCLAPGVLAALPWELARLPEGTPDLIEQYFRSISRTTSPNSTFRETIKWAQIAGGIVTGQRTVTDGIYGQRTRAVVKNLQQQWNLTTTNGDLDQATITAMVAALPKHSRPPARVAIIQPSREEMMQSRRGQSFEWSDFYRKSGFLAQMFADPSWEQLRELIAFAPQIIHLTTTMEESSRGGELGIRLGRQDYVTASRWNQLFKELPSQQMRPLVILEILRPANPLEIWRQIALRNLFATELFHWESTGGILAPGLLERTFHEDSLEAIIAGLAAGNSYADTLARHPMRDVLRGVTSTVLWSADPRLSLLPPVEERPI
jgi:peptidoglycan hydrolase-like protein with peptidoglycan-binding domain